MAKGRPAALPDGGGTHERPDNLSGLLVTHVDEKGTGQATYNFASLPVPTPFQRQLAEVFAVHTKPTGSWRNLPTSEQGYWALRYFTRWLSSNGHIPTDISALSRATWLEFRLATVNDTSASLRALRLTRMLLLETDLLNAETRTEVIRRIRRDAPSEASYNDVELAEIRVAARRVFRVARERIRTNREHLQRHRDGAFEAGTPEHKLGEALEVIATTGDAPRLWHQRDRPVEAGFIRVLGGGAGEKTWKRLYLDKGELTAALILLACKEGWNETTIAELNVPTRLDGTKPGVDETSYRIELEKRRRRAPHRYETRTLTDDGPDSTARLLRQIIEATQPARDLLAAHGIPTDRLLLSHRIRISQDIGGMFQQGLSDGGKDVFARASGLRVNLRRIRKAVNTRYRREPNQNTRATHDSVYVVTDPHVIELSESVIARGVERAVAHAAKAEPLVLPHDAEVGDDTATAACTDEERSPFSPWGIACSVSFLLCLACHNAVVMPKHLGRLAYLHEALSNFRHSLSAETWQRDWADHYDRLLGLRTNHYSDAQWQGALTSLTASDRMMVDHLLKGHLDS